MSARKIKDFGTIMWQRHKDSRGSQLRGVAGAWAEAWELNLEGGEAEL